MASRDFDAQRTAALANLEPIEFGLFGRRWGCAPMLTPAAAAVIEKVVSSTDPKDTMYAGLLFVGEVVNDGTEWQQTLKGAVIDGDTLLDLIVWLAAEYADRYAGNDDPPPAPPDEPVITPPSDPNGAALQIIRGVADLG